MQVGRKIMHYITDHGITQTFLATRANIPLPKLNLALNGKRRLTFEEYEAICGALGVGTETFLTPRRPG